MNKSLTSFITGFSLGSVATIGSIIIVYNTINKSLEKDKKNEDNKHEALLTKIKDILTGTSSEEMINTYTEIINNAHDMFENDYTIILKHISDILNSENEPKYIANVLENYITALDILHDFNKNIYDSIDDDDSTEETTFFEISEEENIETKEN